MVYTTGDIFFGVTTEPSNHGALSLEMKSKNNNQGSIFVGQHRM